MAFCTTCGAPMQVQASFCTKCGTRNSGSNEGVRPLPQGGPASSPSSPSHKNRNFILVLGASGIGVLALVMFVVYQARGGEGYQYASKFWGERLSNCGGSYFSWEMDLAYFTVALYEYKNPSVWVNEQQLSEADRLNGFEWVGTTGISLSSWRVRYASRPVNLFSTAQIDVASLRFVDPWGQWTSVPRITFGGYRIVKQNGTWHVELPPPMFGSRPNLPQLQP